MDIKKLVARFCAVFALAGGIAFTSNAALAQVWGIGPDGRTGYIATRNPISPNCTPPQIWTMTNGHYSCRTPIPPAPTCPTGYTQTAAPTWNGSSWGSPGCILPQISGIPTGTSESDACLGAAATVDPWGTPDSGYMHWTSDLQAGRTLFGGMAPWWTGPTYGSVNDTYATWFNSFPWQNIAQINYQAGGTPNPGTAMADMWVGADSYGGTAACWVTPGTTNVLGVQYYNFQYMNNGG